MDRSILTKIYRDVAEATEIETIEERIVSQNYLYLKSLFDQRFPDKTIELEKKLAHKRSNQDPSTRPDCPECSSNNVISKGTSWRGSSCGREFLKKPRRKHHQQKPQL